MQIVDYGPERRSDLADLVGRVSGRRPDEAELEWFFERNPVRPASVLLAEDGGRVVGTVALGFVRMALGGELVDVGMPMRVATDPDLRGRGIFGRLEAENEQRAADAGIRLLLTVPNAASAPTFLRRLGWSALPPLRLWARARLPLRGSVPLPGEPDGRAHDGEVVRDAAWLDWRFRDAPRDYTLAGGPGYAALGRRGRAGVVAVCEDVPLRTVLRAAGTPLVVAAPPPRERTRYLRAGFVPTPKTLTVLGRSLDGTPLPAAPHFQLGDLDFV